MPKGEKTTQMHWSPQNGRRAVAGQWGQRIALNNTKAKEQLKSDQKKLHLQQQYYIAKNIEKNIEKAKQNIDDKIEKIEMETKNIQDKIEKIEMEKLINGLKRKIEIEID